MTDAATLDINGPTARLTLNRPDQRNALSTSILEALHTRLDELENHPEVVVTVLSGAGKAFCAGMDLKEIVVDAEAGGSGDKDLPRRLLTSLAELTLRIRNLPSVTVASVNGAAVGGGCGLACVCDLAVTNADARLGFPEVDLGLCPAVVAPWLVRKLGPGPARAVLLRGGVMMGSEAYQRGIVDHLAEDREHLDAVVNDLVERLETGGREALAATKGLLNRIDGSEDRRIVLDGAELSAQMVLTEHAQGVLRARLK